MTDESRELLAHLTRSITADEKTPEVHTILIGAPQEGADTDRVLEYLQELPHAPGTRIRVRGVKRVAGTVLDTDTYLLFLNPEKSNERRELVTWWQPGLTPEELEIYQQLREDGTPAETAKELARALSSRRGQQ